MFIYFQIVFVIIVLIFSITLLILLFQNKLFDIIFDKKECIEKEEIKEPITITEDEEKIVLDYGDGETFIMPK